MDLSALSFDAVTTLILGNDTQVGLTIAFALAATVVVLAGLKLGAYGDALGERTGLGSGLIGLIFLAGVTSLPELVVSTTSTIAASLEASEIWSQIQAQGGVNPYTAALYDVYERSLRDGADLAIGNMVGSNVFNLMIIVLMDLVQGQGALLFRLSRRHLISSACGIGMLGILLFGFAFCKDLPWRIPYLEAGPVTPLLFLGYLGCMWLIGRAERRDLGLMETVTEESETDESLISMTPARFYGMLVLLAFLIVLGGIWLSYIGDRMGKPTEAGGFGLGQSFVGTIFLAIATSLPEMVVSIAAVRIKAFDMAAGNVLGSNIFNLVIIFTSDLGLRGASILHIASPAHLVTMAMVLMLTCVVMVGVMYRTQRSFAKIGYDAWLMLAIYIIGNVVLYFQSAYGGGG